MIKSLWGELVATMQKVAGTNKGLATMDVKILLVQGEVVGWSTMDMTKYSPVDLAQNVMMSPQFLEVLQQTVEAVQTKALDD